MGPDPGYRGTHLRGAGRRAPAHHYFCLPLSLMVGLRSLRDLVPPYGLSISFYALTIFSRFSTTFFVAFRVSMTSRACLTMKS